MQHRCIRHVLCDRVAATRYVLQIAHCFVEGFDAQIFPVGFEFNQAVAVGTINFRREIFETLKNFCARMPEIISVADADNGALRLDGS